jgi:hypothetical protein
MLGRILGVSSVIAVVLLWLLLQSTTPASAGPMGVLLVFVSLYVLVLCVLTFLIYWFSHLFVKIIGVFRPNKPIKSLTLLRSYYFSSVLALAPVIFMAMQSVGGVQAYDVILVIIFMTVACFYISKRTA